LLKILADQNIYKIEEFLPQNVELKLYDPKQKLGDLNSFDALFIRTVTKLNRTTIPNIPKSLKLIGTGSSGSDHVDTEYLKSNGINFIDAKGCNANAVSEYVITSLLLWSIKKEKTLSELSIGIIGAGATGNAVAAQLEEFGIPFVLYDPPKELREEGFKSVSIKKVLECDILTFHVPLTKDDEFSTFHWFGNEKLKDQNFELIINASRGGVIDEKALIKAIESGNIKDIIIDVWEEEPNFNTALMKKAFIATPHIAGYSEQAKLNASKLLAKKFAAHFELNIPDTAHLFTNKIIDVADLKYSLYELLLRLNPLREYDVNMREICSRADKTDLFQKMRVDSPYRFEYPFLKLNEDILNKHPLLIKLGINKTK
jgi:erythronate-4-phosphate dehydrogenase